MTSIWKTCGAQEHGFVDGSAQPAGAHDTERCATVPASPRDLRVVGRMTIQNRFEALGKDIVDAPGLNDTHCAATWFDVSTDSDQGAEGSAGDHMSVALGRSSASISQRSFQRQGCRSVQRSRQIGDTFLSVFQIGWCSREVMWSWTWSERCVVVNILSTVGTENASTKPKKTSSNCLFHKKPASGCPYRFRSRRTTGSSMFDHDFGHLCRGRRIQMSGHSDFGIF